MHTRFLYVVVLTTALMAACGSMIGRSEPDGIGDPAASPQYFARVTGTRAVPSHWRL
jgi:hypothetical protein